VGVIFRFDDERGLFGSVSGCPLNAAPGADRSACSRCRYNAAWPGEATPGCHLEVSLATWEAATSALREMNESLHALLLELRRRGPVFEVADADPWDKLAAALHQLAARRGTHAQACAELASTIHAFVASSRRTGRPVRMAE
jgi:hypothetical protein